jgi:hypothetical protein
VYLAVSKGLTSNQLTRLVADSTPFLQTSKSKTANVETTCAALGTAEQRGAGIQAFMNVFIAQQGRCRAINLICDHIELVATKLVANQELSTFVWILRKEHVMQQQMHMYAQEVNMTLNT